MVFKNEENILKVIKYTPPIFIISISIIITIILYFENRLSFEEERANIEKEYILLNKDLIKNNVDIVYNTVLKIQLNTENELKKSLKDRVNEAYTIAMKIYNENKDKDKKTITKMIKDALVDIRFNDGRGYYFIYSFDYECILFPLNRAIEGKNFYNFKEGRGKYLTRDIISQLKVEKEGFMSWYFHKPSDMNKQYRKIGFNKYFEPLDWFIGTGEYLDEFEDSVKKKTLAYISNLQYLNNNYIFVLDYNATYLNHAKPQMIGKNMLIDAQDVKSSKEVYNKAMAIAKNSDGGYLSYIQNIKPNTDKTVEKTSYIKGINNWQWFIGQGFYHDEINEVITQRKKELDKKFQAYIIKISLTSLFLMLLLLFISFYISNILQKKFKRYKDEIKTHLEDNIKQQDLLAQQSKMAAMGEMIGNIAHQWRQPLSVITTVATGIKLHKEMGILKEEDLIESMEAIHNQATYLSKTIDDFRNFLNSSHKKIEFDVKNSIDKAINLVDAQFKNKDIQIIQNVDDLKIFGVENEFIQVLINILNNARDELVKIEKQRVILVEAKKIENQTIISIVDNAGGIKEDIMQRVFEPYFSTKHQTQGTGIGLFMSQEIVTKIMNGKIEVSNRSFKIDEKEYFGAEFRIILNNTNK